MLPAVNCAGAYDVCPHCHQPLIVIEYEGIELDYCPECQGTWCDAGELELVAQLAGAPRGPLHAALGAAGPAGERRCPRCRRKMQTLQVGTEPAVEVDRCPAGDGLWLDAGELAAIVRHFAPGGDAPVAAFFGDMFRHKLTGESEQH